MIVINIDVWIDRWERIYKFLKVKISDKLTLAIGVTGLGIMTKPLWLHLIYFVYSNSINQTTLNKDVIEKFLNAKLTDNDFIFGFSLVILSVVLIMKDTVLDIFNNYLQHKKWEINVKTYGKYFEELNEILDEYSMLFNSYASNIGNKAAGIHMKEAERLILDQRWISIISKICAYFSLDVKRLLSNMRLIISCSLHNEMHIYYELHDICLNQHQNKFRPSDVSEAAIEIYYDLYRSINQVREHVMKENFNLEKFKQILEDNYINYSDNKIRSNRISDIHTLAKEHILFPEYSNKW